MKYRCTREITSAGGDQEFEIEAESMEDALRKFKNKEGVLVVSNCEAMDLAPYDLNSIWLEE